MVIRSLLVQLFVYLLVIEYSILLVLWVASSQIEMFVGYWHWRIDNQQTSKQNRDSYERILELQNELVLQIMMLKSIYRQILSLKKLLKVIELLEVFLARNEPKPINQDVDF